MLVGMMGAGKTSLGRVLAELSGREFADTDQLLQNRFGRSVSQIFQVYGEEAFREHEYSVLKSLVPANNVISTGGGIVLRPENWTEMKRLGVTIYLRAEPETLIARLEASKRKRPLLQVENWSDRFREILSSRANLYEQADVVFDVDDSDPESGAGKLIEILRAR